MSGSSSVIGIEMSGSSSVIGTLLIQGKQLSRGKAGARIIWLPTGLSREVHVRATVSQEEL